MTFFSLTDCFASEPHGERSAGIGPLLTTSLTLAPCLLRECGVGLCARTRPFATLAENRYVILPARQWWRRRDRFAAANLLPRTFGTTQAAFPAADP